MMPSIFPVLVRNHQRCDLEIFHDCERFCSEFIRGDHFWVFRHYLSGSHVEEGLPPLFDAAANVAVCYYAQNIPLIINNYSSSEAFGRYLDHCLHHGSCRRYERQGLPAVNQISDRYKQFFAETAPG